MLRMVSLVALTFVPSLCSSCPADLEDNGLRGVYKDLSTITMLWPAGSDNLQPIRDRVVEFTNCTGARFNLIEVSYAQHTEATDHLIPSQDR